MSERNTWDQSAAAVTAELLQQRTAGGWWEGELSTSALSTATAVMALLQLRLHAPEDDQIPQRDLIIQGGLGWLAEHQNSDGGWGDTVLSISNISTTMLVHAVFHAAERTDLPFTPAWQHALRTAQAHVQAAGGADAVLQRYGKDRTFSIPILTHCALAGTVSWKQVLPLPFELACIPQRWYAAVRMPVVSYALPALIAIGQVIFHHRGHWNPLLRWIRRAAVGKSLRVLASIQPPNGGFLEATPLTSFVSMSLTGCGLHDHPVTRRCLKFIAQSVRPDGSWPIDTNLETWVTTLSVNALSQHGHGRDEQQLDDSAAERIRSWLLAQQYTGIHPYTGAAPGGWSWTSLPGGVPDSDDTPGAMLALLNLRAPGEEFGEAECNALQAAGAWLLNLQNRDGGWPTFCRGWGTLPFDRSSSDLTAHVLRAFAEWDRRIGLPGKGYREAMERGLDFLRRQQRSDGSWLPLWFGNQHNLDDENPLYGTSRVLRALGVCEQQQTEVYARAVRWLLQNQNEDGGWSAVRSIESTVEETALAVESLSGVAGADAAVARGLDWLSAKVSEGEIATPSPIGFYFAKLWYFEHLYPLIFAVSGFRRGLQMRS